MGSDQQQTCVADGTMATHIVGVHTFGIRPYHIHIHGPRSTAHAARSTGSAARAACAARDGHAAVHSTSSPLSDRELNPVRSRIRRSRPFHRAPGIAPIGTADPTQWHWLMIALSVSVSPSGTTAT